MKWSAGCEKEFRGIIDRIPVDYAIQNCFAPLHLEDGSLTIAIAGEEFHCLADELRFIIDMPVLTQVMERSWILKRIAELYGVDPETAGIFGSEYKVEEKTEDRETFDITRGSEYTVIPLVNNLITRAIQERASDIHFERYDNLFRIRFRIDGLLIEQPVLQGAQPGMIISRVKIMAGMDIAENRRPQDGHIRMKNNKVTVDIRASTMPTESGEKIVLRILNRQSVPLTLDSLGFETQLLKDFRKVLGLPYGIILLTGPTGSGKTTTLYSALNFLNHPSLNITSVEDPVEYCLSGINQIRVRPDLELSFACILRTVLRQDPDVIMVGEIRDAETAEIAFRAALTGHLVLSTLHTNDSLSSLLRLEDMGIDPFMIAHSLRMVIAQRLIRKICPECKTRDKESHLRLRNYECLSQYLGREFFTGAGCPSCHFTGYSGRTVVAEYFVMDDDFTKLILKKSPLQELRNLTEQKGYRKLSTVATEKALAGETSLTEVIRETVVL